MWKKGGGGRGLPQRNREIRATVHKITVGKLFEKLNKVLLVSPQKLIKTLKIFSFKLNISISAV